MRTSDMMDLQAIISKAGNIADWPPSRVEPEDIANCMMLIRALAHRVWDLELELENKS